MKMKGNVCTHAFHRFHIFGPRTKIFPGLADGYCDGNLGLENVKTRDVIKI